MALSATLTQKGALHKDDNSESVGWSATNITTQTTTVVKSGQGFIGGILFNKPLANGVVTIYDGVDTNGTKIGTITLPSTLTSDMNIWGAPGTGGIKCNTGITIVTGGANQDITVLWV